MFGAGGVGGFFGGKLARSGVDVCFISRGAHLEALQASGLRVASVHGNFELATVVATSSPAEAGPADYVLVAVKCYHTGQVAAGLGPLLHENTAVISLQNGIDNEEKLAATAGPERVAGGAAYIFAQVTQPGVIEHTGGPAAIVVGEWSGPQSGRLNRLVGACQSAGFSRVIFAAPDRKSPDALRRHRPDAGCAVARERGSSLLASRYGAAVVMRSRRLVAA